MKHRTLVIDDDQSVRHSLKRVLQVSGYSVVAASGMHGIGSLKQGAFDLLLLDLDLPDLRGWEILEYAVQHQPQLPIVLLTGLMNQCAVGAFAGTDAVLEKPMDVTLLLQTVARILSEPKDERLRRRSSGALKASIVPAGTSHSARDLQDAGLLVSPAGRSSKNQIVKPPLCDLSLFQTGCPSQST